MSGFEALWAELRGDLDPLGAALLGALDGPAGTRLGRTEERRRLEDLTLAGLREEIEAFRAGRLPTDSDDFAAYAELAPAPSRRLALLFNVYRASQMVLWEAWFGLVEGSGLTAGERHELLERGSHFFFSWSARSGDLIAEQHQRAVDTQDGSIEQRRFRAIGELLGGDPRAAASLGFDLDRHHVGVIAWDTEDPAASARELAAALERPLLSVTPLDGGLSCWAWVSGTRPLAATGLAALKSFVPRRGRLALGLEGAGEDGFRSTHRQAQQARRLAFDQGPRVIRYEDVVLEALAGGNEAEARAFVAHELRGIEDDSPASRRIRETLAAYFLAEYNAAMAGSTLGVHQQTVANRLRAAEERLGRPSIRSRRVELEMALRLRACLERRRSEAG